MALKIIVFNLQQIIVGAVLGLYLTIMLLTTRPTGTARTINMIVFFFVLIPAVVIWTYLTYNSLINEIWTPNELPEAKESSWVLAIVYWFFVISTLINFLVLNFLLVCAVIFLFYFG